MSGDLRCGPGVVLAIAEEDYCYGVGMLVLRVEEFGAHPSSFPKLEWVRVAGTEVRWDADGEWRQVMVRVGAIRGAIRPPTWRPAPVRRQAPPAPA
jgi:hypothetical protein